MKRTEDLRLVRLLWNWMCRHSRLVVLVILLWVLAGIVGGRVQQMRIADAREQGRAEAIAAEQLRAEELAQISAAAPFADGASVEQVQREAEYVAKVLYAVRDNSRAGQKLTVWCVICRCQQALYPSTVEAVCRQEQQWMGYSDNNPVLQDLYSIAYEELAYWHSGGYLPMTANLVYLEWTPKEITLRDSFDGSGTCHYFYESDWETFEAARENTKGANDADN